MSAVTSSPLAAPNRGASSLIILSCLALGVLALLAPTLFYLSKHVWSGEEQGHGPIIGAVSLWLMWRKRSEVIDAPYKPMNWFGSVLFAVSLVTYVLGRSQQIIQLEFGSLLGLLISLVLLLRGKQALKAIAFPIFFLIFMVPFPGVLVQAITIPLKSGVSVVAEAILYHLGYPIARTGVILSIGQYQLLVADACAGLNSMFTLEALGLLYLNLMGYTSKVRNVLLAILVIPISFVSNVVRVMILVLVTYYFGDAAGQGFVHAFAGMVLFGVGLMMMITTDGFLGRLLGQNHGARQA